MRTTVQILLMFMISSTFMMAQRTVLEGKVVNQSEVPEAVRSSQSENFPDAKVMKWRFQKAMGARGNSAERYVSVFKLGNRPLSNARYKPDGSILYFTEYYGPKTIPAILKPELAKNFSGHKITSGVHIKLYGTQKEFYRIRLKNGAQVTYVYYDKEGNQVDRNALPKDVNFN